MYYSVSCLGDLMTSQGIPVPLRNPIMMHDFVVTERVNEILAFYSIPGTTKGPRPKHILSWRPELGSRIGVFPRGLAGDPTDQVKWFNIETCGVIHTGAGWEEGDDVVLVAPRSIDVDLRGLSGIDQESMGEVGRLHIWRLNMRTGKVEERTLDNTLPADFPVVNNKYACGRTRYVYEGFFAADDPKKFGATSTDCLESSHSKGVVKYDLGPASSNSISALLAGTSPGRKRITFPPKTYGGEAVFVPRDSATPAAVGGEEAEDDGFLVVIVRDEAREVSELHVYDARTMDQTPIARLAIPHRVPYGFHGLWITPEQIEGQRVKDAAKAKEAGTDPIPEIGLVSGGLARLLGTVASLL
ncbi:hypothetical protein HDU93_009547 [Gonapodya sp. JEL0774]|nr:hypothetical protein HDU93_009547 [Gonapodya sp. JEL0774]